MRYEPFEWYEVPLYYDIVFDQTTAEEAAFVEAVFVEHAAVRPRRGRTVLEPACGSGRLLQERARRGWRAAGFDASAGMVALAAARAPDASIWRDDMISFRTRSTFDLAFNLLSTFKHVERERDAQRHLGRVAEVLRPGGLYVLGVHTTDYEETRRRRERWVAARDGVEVTCNIQVWPADRAARRERVRARLVVDDHGETRRLESHFNFRTYDEEELEALVASEPRLRHVATYGFDHDIRRPRAMGDGRLDQVLVLRREG